MQPVWLRVRTVPFTMGSSKQSRQYSVGPVVTGRRRLYAGRRFFFFALGLSTALPMSGAFSTLYNAVGLLLDDAHTRAARQSGTQCGSAGIYRYWGR